jgi:transposase
LELRDGQFVYARETDRFNGQSFWDFMKLLQERSRQENQRVMVISDNAKYHHAKMHKARREAQAPGFELDYLPPYSPDLNPIERVWKLTRRLCLHDEYFASLDSTIVAVEKEFAGWALGSATVRKLCALS